MSIFVVIEGIDGAGTTSLTRLLQEALEAAGQRVHATREPSGGPVGSLIRQALSHRLSVATAEGSEPLAWQTMALLFAADRLDHVQAEVEPHLRAGEVVISDRYDYSSVAYQSVVGGGASEVIEWVKSLNRYARRPDITLVVDVKPETAAARRQGRGGGPELYEKNDLQARLADFYRSIDQHFQDNIVHIDGEQPLQEVAKQALDAVRKLL